jgi:hypothetical protein
MASLGAPAAPDAAFPAKNVGVLGYFVAAKRATANAGGAERAFVGVIGELRLPGLGLRVVAPDASERAPFQKDRGPNPRAVVYGKSLDVKYNA